MKFTLFLMALVSAMPALVIDEVFEDVVWTLVVWAATFGVLVLRLGYEELQK